MEHMQSEMQRRDEDAQLFSNLFKQGMLATNDQGNITVVKEPDEQERMHPDQNPVRPELLEGAEDLSGNNEPVQHSAAPDLQRWRRAVLCDDC